MLFPQSHLVVVTQLLLVLSCWILVTSAEEGRYIFTSVCLCVCLYVG